MGMVEWLILIFVFFAAFTAVGIALLTVKVGKLAKTLENTSNRLQRLESSHEDLQQELMRLRTESQLKTGEPVIMITQLLDRFKGGGVASGLALLGWKGIQYLVQGRRRKALSRK